MRNEINYDVGTRNGSSLEYDVNSHVERRKNSCGLEDQFFYTFHLTVRALEQESKKNPDKIKKW